MSFRRWLGATVAIVISDTLNSSATLPAGQAANIPLRMRVNLRELFDGPAESLFNVAAGVAGLRADSTRVTLRATPTIDTPIGPMTYPSPITIGNATLGGSGAR